MKRPVGVTILAVIAIIYGIFSLLLALLGLLGSALLASGVAAVASRYSAGTLAYATISDAVLGILYLAFGIGAFSLKGWAWTAGVVGLVLEVLHVPDLAGRYYVVQLTDPWGTDFAYVGRRTTGTKAGDYLISGPGWHGTVPARVKQIRSPDNTVFLIGRTLVESDSDLATAYGLAKQIQVTPKQIQVTPLSHWPPSP